MTEREEAITIFEKVIFQKSKRFKDDRGFLQQIYDRNSLDIINPEFSLSYFSFSNKNVLRGLHFQRGKNSQKKLITLIKGRVFDVIVDVRRNSSSYGEYRSQILDANEIDTVWIPEGFAHGFQALGEENIMLYQIIGDYEPQDEVTFYWNDANLEIEWPNPKEAIVSNKDKNGILFKK